MPKISIIVPCYNQAHFLSDAISSLKDQAMKDWECIIVNDGSTDNTAEVAEKLAQTDIRIRVINQHNKGLSGARNSGVKAAHSELLQFLDADDILEHDKLRVQVEFLHVNPEIDIVFGDARYFTTENTELRDYGHYSSNKKSAWIFEMWYAHGALLEKLISGNLFPVNCPLVRKSVFSYVGYWNEALDAHEDWEFWIRCAAANIKIEILDRPNTLALIRMHSTSMTSDTSRMHSSVFKMRIAVGSLITDPVLRMSNFKKGLQALQLLKQPNKLNSLVDLFYTNRSLGTFFVALCFYITESAVSKNIVRIYRTLIPWPIQKSIASILRIKVS